MQWWKSALEVIAIPFAIGYAIISYFQWRDAAHNFRGDERAWLGPETFDMVIVTGKPTTITAHN
jgi:hypothetical protein